MSLNLRGLYKAYCALSNKVDQNQEKAVEEWNAMKLQYKNKKEFSECIQSRMKDWELTLSKRRTQITNYFLHVSINYAQLFSYVNIL